MAILTTQSGQEETLLTAKDVSRTLKVPEGTLAQWRHKGKGPIAIKLESGVVRYRLSEFREWFDAQESRSSSAA